MTLTLLFDLDDTLLHNPIQTFLPEYTQGLAKRLQDAVEPRAMIHQLMFATGSMEKNLNPSLSLRKVFDEDFYPALNIQRKDVQPALDEFYQNDFPKLQHLTQQMPEAIAAVNTAVQRGFQLALATNPLFPKTAIQQRLSWAGLPVDHYPWAIIPCYEDFHFAKPNPEFYNELLGQIGCPDGPVVMVGNDFQHDIQPAQVVGMATYWVQDSPWELMEPASPQHARGRLTELFSWLDQTPPETLIPDFSGIQSLLTGMRALPAAMLSLTHSLSETIWRTRPSAKEWCLTEIACHLRDVESEVNLPRIKQVLTRSNPFIAGKDTDAWADKRQYFQQDGPQALDDFVQLRMTNLEILSGLTQEDWDLPARHAIFGPSHLGELVGFSASHDRLHMQTIYQIVNQLHGL